MSGERVMSQHIFKSDDVEVLMGYDRPLDYVFCVVERGGPELASWSLFPRSAFPIRT